MKRRFGGKQGKVKEKASHKIGMAEFESLVPNQLPSCIMQPEQATRSLLN